MNERADDIGQFVFERFSESAKLVLFFARAAVSEHGGAQIGTAHLMMGIIQVVPDVADLLASDWTGERLRGELLRLVPARVRVEETVEIPLTSDALETIHRAVREADRLHSRLVTPDHVFLGLLDESAEDVGRLLRKAGVSRASILTRLTEG